MNGIGGNIKGVLQLAETTENAIGERVQVWKDAQTLTGWLDMLSGSAGTATYNARIMESTHVFVCDFAPLLTGLDAETARMMIDGKAYEITLLDNPMGLGAGSQLEIYLKFTGGL